MRRGFTNDAYVRSVYAARKANGVYESGKQAGTLDMAATAPIRERPPPSATAGEWSPTFGYKKGELVTFLGESFVAGASSCGVPPPAARFVPSKRLGARDIRHLQESRWARVSAQRTHDETTFAVEHAGKGFSAKAASVYAQRKAGSLEGTKKK